MPISTSFEFYDTFNYEIMKIKESGILHYIVKTYETTDGGISRNCENPRRQKGSPIDMYTIISPAILFIGGICASVLLLIIENCWKFGNKKEEPKSVDELYSTSSYSTDGNHTSQISINSICS